MKTLVTILLIISGTCLFATAAAQTNTNPPKTSKEEQQERNIPGRQSNTNVIDLSNTIWHPVPKSRREKIEQKAAKIKDEKKYAGILKKIRAVPPSYKEKYTDLLNDEKMHLVRIYPDRNCDLLEKKIVSVQETERCDGVVPIAMGGSKYSFKEKTNIFSGSSDIHFINNKFVTDKDADSGLIGEIGDVSLQDINLNSEAAKFLVNTIPETIAELHGQINRREKGDSSSGYSYSVSAPVKLNSTYVLRSTTYEQIRTTGKDETGRSGNKKTYKLKMVKNMMVAFKVVGQETDGSVILLWKKLQ